MELKMVSSEMDERREAVNNLKSKVQDQFKACESVSKATADGIKRGEAEIKRIHNEAKKNMKEAASILAHSEKANQAAVLDVEENERHCTREREAMVQFITETLGTLMEHKSSITDTLTALNQRFDEELAATENL